MRLRSRLFYSYLFFLLVYSGFTLLPKPLPAILRQYHISATRLRILDLTIIVLLAAIWYVGFYGYAKLSNYNQLIDGSKDGKPTAKLTQGVFLLVMWLPVSFTTSAILNFFAMRHTHLLPAVTIINHYISLILPFVGFFYISMGTRGLSELVRQRPTFRAINIMAVILVYIGLIDYHLVAATPNRAAVYHLSIWLILLTLMAPYICMWFMGILSTYEVYRYRMKVAGIVYRKSWSLFALGLGWLIVASICFQYLTTITSRLNQLSIYWVLLIIYSLLLVLSAGFILIAAGTRKLQRIEEV